MLNEVAFAWKEQICSLEVFLVSALSTEAQVADPCGAALSWALKMRCKALAESWSPPTSLPKPRKHLPTLGKDKEDSRTLSEPSYLLPEARQVLNGL